MSKFSPGEEAFVVIGPIIPSNKELAKYDRSFVEVLYFEGNFLGCDKQVHNEGDWYVVRSLDDGQAFGSREVTLFKLPPNGDLKQFYRYVGYSPPTKKTPTVPS